MKAKSLKAKLYLLKCKSGQNFMLKPAADFVEVPADADFDYLKKLADNGLVAVDGSFDAVEDVVDDQDDELELLREEYELLADKKADGRWSESKLKEKIAELTESE